MFDIALGAASISRCSCPSRRSKRQRKGENELRVIHGSLNDEGMKNDRESILARSSSEARRCPEGGVGLDTKDPPVVKAEANNRCFARSSHSGERND